MKKINNDNESLGYMNESKDDILKRTKEKTNIDKSLHKKPNKIYKKFRKSNLYDFRSSNKNIKLNTDLTNLKQIKSQYITLKKIIIKTLTLLNFQTSIELSKYINTNFKKNYKRNTISEACSQLIFEKIIKKRNRNSGKRGRPHIEFYINIKKEEL